MTNYQLSLLNFLRMKRDFPELNHIGHEPKPTPEALMNGVPEDAPMERLTPWKQRRDAEREFYRLDPH